MSYAELIPYSTPGFVAFGICAIPAGWMADKWSREGMMVVQGLNKTGVPLAINGIFGNMGVASAAVLTGYLIDNSGWEAAFILPGVVSIVVGIAYWIFVVSTRDHTLAASAKKTVAPLEISRGTLVRIFSIIFFTAAIGGFVFQSTTFALPKVFDERLSELAQSATMIGTYAFIAFSVAAFAQLVVGHLVDHHPVRYVFMGIAAMQAVFFFAMTQVDGIAALIIAIAFMLAVFGQIPINDVLVGRMARSEWRSRAYSLRYIVTFSVYGSTVPLIAWIHANWGFGTLFLVLGICASLIFAATLLLPARETSAPAAAAA
jgi:MFS family permease